jgi:hypothetical protein
MRHREICMRRKQPIKPARLRLIPRYRTARRPGATSLAPGSGGA